MVWLRRLRLGLRLLGGWRLLWPGRRRLRRRRDRYFFAGQCRLLLLLELFQLRTRHGACTSARSNRQAWQACLACPAPHSTRTLRRPASKLALASLLPVRLPVLGWLGFMVALHLQASSDVAGLRAEAGQRLTRRQPPAAAARARRCAPALVRCPAAAAGQPDRTWPLQQGYQAVQPSAEFASLKAGVPGGAAHTRWLRQAPTSAVGGTAGRGWQWAAGGRAHAGGGAPLPPL